jgi:hypothetical protein
MAKGCGSVSGSTTLGKRHLVWQEEPADSWEETLEVKDSWEMEEETVKVKKCIRRNFLAVL